MFNVSITGSGHNNVNGGKVTLATIYLKVFPTTSLGVDDNTWTTVGRRNAAADATGDTSPGR